MEPEQIKKLLQIVASRHKIILDEDDPALAVVTMVQELILEDHKKMELLLKNQAIIIEESTSKILADAKDISEKVINTKAEKIFQTLDQLFKELERAAINNIEAAAAKNKIIVAKNNASQIKSNRINLIIAGSSFITLIVGICIGILIKT